MQPQLNEEHMKQVHYIYDLDDKIAFGKYEGKTIQEILNWDAQYLHWCIQNLESFGLSAAAMGVAKTKASFFANVETVNDVRIEHGITQKRRLEREQEWEDSQDDYYYEEDFYPEHYGEYAGTYAQDVEGLSDEFIDDVLGGDPDAYWNID